MLGFLFGFCSYKPHHVAFTCFKNRQRFSYQPTVHKIRRLQISADSALPLTKENVEQVLEELRPYLIADGGNVSLTGIDGATVRLTLEGACGSCPSSTVTLRMGIETRLKEKIPEIEAVVQEETMGPELNEQNIDSVLDEVRPFLKIAGGKIDLVGIYGTDSPSPSVSLKMSGGGAAVDSVRLEIIHRLKRNFPKLVNVHYVKA
ncbi:iron-sulfur cluster scaffold protein [Galdieria sulphuraria]|uniref:Iron-sulfur cluster scaffold protein n=1 Tax=Galdieria sulphuraria TaxID=130081 RepID=M2WRR0_GALSU|nr:iron-sulfur cluster scaffold protein [Galdieria sulphuraria]EME26515.1 iron-sulfur cluster scaffold protein [Galdieria sulphuraria]|eukprot:XP_005703035.1 iron-sulfur cluster scaffold protein [Galdieria sulphuraria]